MNSDARNKTDMREARRRHYEVEKELAARLMATPREQRPHIYRTMYQELFERVPEHARLSEAMSPEQMKINLAREIRLVEKYLTPETDLIEFAPGTCRFSYHVAQRVRSVTAVDISDQRRADIAAPYNFRHVVYDGYHLDMEDACADVIFSNQFIEHIHPEDTLLHFQLAHRLLRDGGHYVFCTPHLFMGPWDVSRDFSDTAEGFHLKEWTYRELRDVILKAGFRKATLMIWVKGKPVPIPLQGLYLLLEDIVGKLGKPLRRKFSHYLFAQILFTAAK